jgi:hypothetical protein
MSNQPRFKPVRSKPTRSESSAHVDVPYIPHCAVLLNGLGIEAYDLEGNGKILVDAEYLRFLLTKIISCFAIDEQSYERDNPDVHGAKLAGEIESYRAHFERYGYFEGRTPYPIPFDPVWYGAAYADLKDRFANDPIAARRHFFDETGYREGRAGIAAHLNDAEQWRGGHYK